MNTKSDAKLNTAAQTKPRGRRLRRIMDIVFYAGLVVSVSAVLLYSSGNGRSIFGISFFWIETPSMADELPVGSLIMTKRTAQSEINTGDDITFLKADGKTVTHRVLSIYENYENSGMRGFQTYGINNSMPDRETVYADNVIGKVIMHVPKLGLVFRIISGNIISILVSVAAIITLSISLKVLLTDKPKQGTDPES